MSIKLFILGRPGSGKTTAFHHIEEYLRLKYKNWSITRYNDYDILQEMFRRENLLLFKKRQFEAKEPDGFDVLDFSVLDKALVRLEKDVRARSSWQKDEIIIIEFARQDYRQALDLFSASFLEDAYFLFLDADPNICVQRVKNRITTPPTPDNYFVSEKIITGYYGKQIIPNTIKIRNKEVVNKDRIKVVSNQGVKLNSVNLNIERFTDLLIAQNTPITQSHLAVHLSPFKFAAVKSYLGMIPVFFYVFNLKKVSPQALLAKLVALHSKQQQIPQEKEHFAPPR